MSVDRRMILAAVPVINANVVVARHAFQTAAEPRQDPAGNVPPRFPRFDDLALETNGPIRQLGVRSFRQS